MGNPGCCRQGSLAMSNSTKAAPFTWPDDPLPLKLPSLYICDRSHVTDTGTLGESH